jgi:hypothetical protein
MRERHVSDAPAPYQVQDAQVRQARDTRDARVIHDILAARNRDRAQAWRPAADKREVGEEQARREVEGGERVEVFADVLRCLVREQDAVAEE